MIARLVRWIGRGIALCGTAALCAWPALAAAAQFAARPAGAANLPFSAISGSVRATTAFDTGAFNRARISVEVVLAPRAAPRLAGLLTNLSNPRSASYGHWLQKGQFDALFAPSAAQRAAVASYLQASGLTVGESGSPFLVRASGSSSMIASAFRTSLHTYRTARGIAYFANATAVQLPSNVAGGVLGVVGLASTMREHPAFEVPFSGTASPAKTASCGAPYPTAQQLFAAVNSGTGFPFGYGGGPGCTGLTPAQVNAIYGAPNVGSRGKGAGVNLAVFELSGYQHADIASWAHYFYGAQFTAPLVDINVDGGPVTRGSCPSVDYCYYGYSGDVEVDADIEIQLAVAPAASHILVYNAPNDVTGQTELDEYRRIAADDSADVVSSSWPGCEYDATLAYVQAENLVFEQMALQGQSVFSAAGDTGPFGCLLSDGITVVSQLDPAAQPWVTGVGGTSLENFNPAASSNPSYPAGIESVWNVADLCNTSLNEGDRTGYFWCAETGAGGGGNSLFWPRPFFQFGAGISNPYNTQCAVTSAPLPCREVPDVSADADPYTGYAEYCTDNASTPEGACAALSSRTAPGWFAIGGTSLSSPLWSAIIADRDSYQKTRSGNASALLYQLYSVNAHGYFNDITGLGQTTTSNGLFPTVPGYDLATGLGTPRMAPIITGIP